MYCHRWSWLTASGIGLATSKLLVSEGWQVVIFDKGSHGEKVAQELNAFFIETDVTDYNRLAHSFLKVWQKYGRLNFVFANAGILETQSFYTRRQENEEGIPPPLNLKSLDVNLCGCINTAYLAMHFLPKTKGTKSLIMTCSSGGLYPVRSAPIYAAAKHGVLGFTRSIAKKLMDDEGIRVNCICPGATRTGIIDPNGWNIFPEDVLTDPEQVAEVVKSVLDDQSLYGKAVEIVKNSTYFREQSPFVDDRVEKLILLTDQLL